MKTLLLFLLCTSLTAFDLESVVELDTYTYVGFATADNHEQDVMASVHQRAHLPDNLLFVEVGLQHDHDFTLLFNPGVKLIDYENFELCLFTGGSYSLSDQTNRGNRFNFANGAYVVYRDWTFRWTHLSNASLYGDHNPGYDAVMLGRGWRF